MMSCRATIVAIAALTTGGCATSPDLPMVVAPCNAMLLYGNAAASGLCQSVSPATQNLWVCELASSPDIHTTFNNAVNLHLTVRTAGQPPACDQNASLDGAWPALIVAAGQPGVICGVDVGRYVARLNAVPATYASVPAAFTAAYQAGRISVGVQQSWVAKAVQLGCP